MLVELIQDEFQGVPVEILPRKYYNEQSGKSLPPVPRFQLRATIGLEFIQQLCVDDEERAGTILAVSDK